MNRLLIFCLPALFLFSCSRTENTDQHSASGDAEHSIVILPFIGTDTDLARDLKMELGKKMAATITVAAKVPLPTSAFYRKRQRYIADSLLVFLEDYSTGRFQKVIGITSSDISTRKGGHANWGIMGLGYCPGKSCVISSFRVQRSSRNRQQYTKRMTVLALHELGHTYSLPHCKSEACLMRDAEGKMNLDNGENYCTSCDSYLKKRGVLK